MTNQEIAEQTFANLLSISSSKRAFIVSYWEPPKSSAPENLLLCELNWEALKLWKDDGDPNDKLLFKNSLKNLDLLMLFNEEQIKTVISLRDVEGKISIKSGKILKYKIAWHEWGVIIDVENSFSIINRVNNMASSVTFLNEFFDLLEKSGKALLAAVILIGTLSLGQIFNRVVEKPSVAVKSTNEGHIVPEPLSDLLRYAQKNTKFLGNTVVVRTYLSDALLQSEVIYFTSDSTQTTRDLLDRERDLRNHEDEPWKSMRISHKELKPFEIPIDQYPIEDLRLKFQKKGYLKILYIPFKPKGMTTSYLTIAIRQGASDSKLDTELTVLDIFVQEMEEELSGTSF